MPAILPFVRLWAFDVFGIFCLASFAFLAYAHHGDTSVAMDISVYRDIATRASAHQTDASLHVNSEYPPLATTLFWIAHSLTQGSDFAGAWLVTIVAAALCAWMYLRCFSSRDALLLAFVLPFSVLILGHDMVFARYDVFVGLALILSARSHTHRSYAESAAWLSIAIALKIVPVLALPILIAVTPRRHWKALMFGMLCAAAVGIMLSVGVLGVSGVLDNIRYVADYHGDRSVQLESLWSGLSMLQALALGRVIHTGYQNMSVINVDVTHHFVLLAKMLVVGGLGYLLYRIWKTKQSHDFGALLSVILLWALAVSPVLSPQYFTWVVPLVLVVTLGRCVDKRDVSPRAILVIGLTLLTAYLTKWIFPAHYNDLIGQHTLPMLMLNLRNGALLLLTYFMLTDSGVIKPVHSLVAPQHLFGINRAFLVDTMLAVIAIVVLFAVHPMLVVQPHTQGYLVNGAYEAVERLPISRDFDADTIVVMTDLIVPKLAQHRFFRVRPDDCVEAIVINGQTMPKNIVQFCDGAGRGRIFDFGPYMETGKNTINVTIRNTGGPMGMDLAASVTPLLFMTLMTVMAVMLWYLTQCYRLYCAILLSPLPAPRAEMLYTRAVLWIRSRLPALGSSTKLPDGQTVMSI